jgi:tetratricopeptide (TPR) repeat protein
MPPSRKFRSAVLVTTVVVSAVAVLSLAGCGRKSDPRVQQGYDLVVAGNVDEAIASMNAILADEPEHAGARNVLGLALYKTGDIEGAVEQYRMAIHADPRHPEAHFNLGNALRRLDRTNEAEAEFVEAIRHQKDFVLAHYNLGKIYEKSGRIEPAETEYRKAIDYDPQFTFAYVDLGKILYDRGDFSAAVQNFARALELDPTYKEVRVYLGNAYMQSGVENGLTLAENEYRAAVGIDPEFLDAVYSLGISLAAQSRRDEAIEWFEKASVLLQDQPADHPMRRQIRQYFEQVNHTASGAAAG